MAFKQKMVNQLVGTSAVTAIELSRRTGVRQQNMSRWLRHQLLRRQAAVSAMAHDAEELGLLGGRQRNERPAMGSTARVPTLRRTAPALDASKIPVRRSKAHRTDNWPPTSHDAEGLAREG